MYEINICHLYPDLLNLYGDAGNITVLSKRAKWRGINVSVKKVSLDESFIPEEYDIVFLGGGQHVEQDIVRKDLISNKGNEIINAIENNKVFLCICGGYQLLGKYFVTLGGETLEFLGALDVWTIDNKERLTGNLVVECDFLKANSFDGIMVGFENHSGRTYLGNNVLPLGRVLKGNGNNGEDKYEGAVYKNVYCSYSHGSLLSKNPLFADHLLTLALKQKYHDFSSLCPLDDSLEYMARNFMIQRLLKG